jgi:hypothetical protein
MVLGALALGVLPREVPTVNAARADGAEGSPDPNAALARKGSCPDGEALLLCLSFEQQLIDEAMPSAQLTGEPLVYEAGPTGMAVRAGAETLVRADRGVGAVGKSFTAEAWMRVDRFPEAGQRAGVIDKQSHFGLFVQPGGDVTCAAYGATATARKAAAVGEWLSAACTADGNTLTIFINGVSRDEATFLLPLNLGPDALAIGSNQPAGDPIYGLIDNVRVWNRARAAAELCADALGCSKP